MGQGGSWEQRNCLQTPAWANAPGKRYLRRVLVQCALAARQTPTFLGCTFRRLEVRLGMKKAAVAVAHKLLVIVYHLLSEGTVYDEQRYAHLQSKQEERRRVPSRRLRAWAIMSP